MSSAAEIYRHQEWVRKEERNRKDRERRKEKKIQDDEPSKDAQTLASIYQALRVETSRLEELIEKATELSPRELHRMDKSVVVQKAGFKMIKRILTRRGYRGLKREAFDVVFGQAQEIRVEGESEEKVRINPQEN